jgi:hypothetical protein
MEMVHRPVHDVDHAHGKHAHDCTQACLHAHQPAFKLQQLSAVAFQNRTCAVLERIVPPPAQSDDLARFGHQSKNFW